MLDGATYVKGCKILSFQRALRARVDFHWGRANRWRDYPLIRKVAKGGVIMPNGSDACNKQMRDWPHPCSPYRRARYRG